MELKWTAFSEKDPCMRLCYITDFNTVWTTADSKNYVSARDKNELYWAEIPIPEVPKKPKKIHKCIRNEFTCHYLNNHLTLTYQKLNFLNIPVEDSVHTSVKICPFCGFKPEE